MIFFMIMKINRQDVDISIGSDVKKKITFVYKINLLEILISYLLNLFANRIKSHYKFIIKFIRNINFSQTLLPLYGAK